MTLAEVDAVAAKLRGDAVAPTDAGTADGTRESPPPADAERKQRTSKNARRGKLKAAVLALNIVATNNTPWGDYGHLIEADITANQGNANGKGCSSGGTRTILGSRNLT